MLHLKSFVWWTLTIMWPFYALFTQQGSFMCFFFFYRTFGVSTRKKKSCKTLLKYNRVSYKWINILSYFLATASFPPSTFSRTVPPPPTPGDPRPAFHSLRSAPGHHTSAGFPSLARRSHRGSRRERRSARRPSVPRLGGSSARNSDKWTGAGRTEQLQNRPAKRWVYLTTSETNSDTILKKWYDEIVDFI